MAKLDLKEYARLGAQARVDQLHAELTEIYRAFPGLRARGGRTAAVPAGAAARATAAPRKRKKRTMTAAQKREVSQRMKRYWAARRKEKQDGKKG